MSRLRARLTSQDSERGSVMSLVLVFSLFALVALLALADSGQKLNTLSGAYDLAGETARYAAGFIEPGSVQAGEPRIDETRAVAEATAFALDSGADTVTVNVAADGLSVVVSISVTGPDPITPGFDMSTQVRHEAFVLADPDATP